MAILRVDDGGSNTSPYDTWAKAATTLQTALTAWSDGDVIYIHGGASGPHNESYSSSQVLTATGDSSTATVPIYAVDKDNSNAAITDPTTPGAPLFQVTGSNVDLVGNIFSHWHGVWLQSEEGLELFNGAGQSGRTTNCKLVAALIDDDQISVGAAESLENAHIGTTFEFGAAAPDAAQQCHLDIGNCGWVRFYRCTFLDNNKTTNTQLILLSSGQTNPHVRFEGCDFTGLQSITTLSNTTVVRHVEVDLVQCRFPASFVIATNVTPGNVWRVINSDEDSGDLFRREVYTGFGTIKTDSAVFRSSGWSDETESGISAVPLSYVFSPVAACKEHQPLCDIPLFANIATTGSKTFTVQGVENFTTALQNDEAWIELQYMDVLAQTTWQFASTRVIAGSATADLTTGVALTDWTAEPSGSRSIKFVITKTINRTGYYKIIPHLGKFESGKVMHICPKVDIT